MKTFVSRSSRRCGRSTARPPRPSTMGYMITHSARQELAGGARQEAGDDARRHLNVSGSRRAYMCRHTQAIRPNHCTLRPKLRPCATRLRPGIGLYRVFAWSKGGSGGIRTPGTSRYARFQGLRSGVREQPGCVLPLVAVENHRSPDRGERTRMRREVRRAVHRRPRSSKSCCSLPEPRRLGMERPD
jgi:hypothetical protein